MQHRFYAYAIGVISLCAVEQAAASDSWRTYGDYMQRILPAVALGTTVLKEDYEGTKQWTRHAISTVGMVYVTKESLKDTQWGRRPKGNGERAFVSGHTSYACSGAAFMGRRYGWEYGLPSFALAAGVGYSRVQADKHHWRDVIAGCGFTYGLSRLFVTPEGEEKIRPVIGPEFVGLRFESPF